MENIYHIEALGKTFYGPEEDIVLFKNLSFDIKKGESLAILGASGSGKSTLLHLLGALDTPAEGQIFFRDKNIQTFTPEEQAKFRNKSIGFVFQFHHLLPEFSTLENVAIPGMIAKLPKEKIFTKAKALIERVGLSHRIKSKPATLSGGERQRVAIARAMLLDPEVILADEPTGNLDEHTGDRISSLLLELNKENGTTLVTVTHNSAIAQKMDRALELKSGELYEKKYF